MRIIKTYIFVLIIFTYFISTSTCAQEDNNVKYKKNEIGIWNDYFNLLPVIINARGLSFSNSNEKDIGLFYYRNFKQNKLYTRIEVWNSYQIRYYTSQKLINLSLGKKTILWDNKIYLTSGIKCSYYEKLYKRKPLRGVVVGLEIGVLYYFYNFLIGSDISIYIPDKRFIKEVDSIDILNIKLGYVF